MEKPAAAGTKQRGGLLVRLILIAVLSLTGTVAAQSQRISQEYIDTLQFVPQEGYFFTDRECLFSLDIRDVTPDEVQVFFDASADNVQFVSAKKSDLVLSQNGISRRDGTSLQVRVQFFVPGTYELPSVYVRIQQREYRIPFARVTVYQNPQTILPELSVVFSDPRIDAREPYISARAGDRLDFTVYVRYAVQVVGFSWELPKDSLFEQTREFPITEGRTRGTEFSSEAVPVATFKWQPLVQGTYQMPAVTLTATAYSGSRIELALPSYLFDITPRDDAEAESVPGERETVFAYAFEPPRPTEQEEAQALSLDARQYGELLSLRTQERHSFPFSQAAQQRKALEGGAGLSSDEPEPSIPLLVTLCALTGILVLITVLCFLLRHVPLGAIFLSLSLMGAAASVATAVYVGQTAALCRGGELCSIPEAHVSAGVYVPAGSRVRIRQSAGGWVYIQYKELKGWVPENDIDYIR